MRSDEEIIVRAVIGGVAIAFGVILVVLGMLESSMTGRTLQIKQDWSVRDFAFVIAGILAFLVGCCVILSL